MRTKRWLSTTYRQVPIGVLVLILFVCAISNAEHLPVKTYTTADGLLRDTAYCIMQDSRGFLWFCTADGLSRYDGYQFINYTTDDGLPNRIVNDFLETRAGVYWVATNDGLARLNPKGHRGQSEANYGLQTAQGPSEPMFVSYKPEDSQAKSIEVLFEDAQGRLWCGGLDRLYWLEDRDGEVSFHRVELPRAKNNKSFVVLAISADNRGSLWFGTDGQGLYRRSPDGQIEQYTSKNGLPSMNVTALLLDRGGKLWVGMSLDGGVCQLVDSPTAERKAIARCFTKRDGLAGNWIREINQASDGKMWFSTTGGVSTFAEQTEKGQFAFRVYKEPQGLCDGEAYATKEDRDGNVWVATSCGLKKITRSGFVRFTQSDGLASLFVSSIFKSHTGELFVITKHSLDAKDKTIQVHSINRYQREAFSFVTPRLPQNVDTGWGGGQIVIQDQAGDWWLPGNQHRVYRFNKSNQSSYPNN